MKPHYDKAQLLPLAVKASFVRIDPADWKLPNDNQSMSNLVFSVGSYILVLRSMDYVNHGERHVFLYLRGWLVACGPLNNFCHNNLTSVAWAGWGHLSDKFRVAGGTQPQSPHQFQDRRVIVDACGLNALQENEFWPNKLYVASTFKKYIYCW